MERLRGLDALRGMAAMLVVAQHMLGILSRDYSWAGWVISIADLGKLGVAIFFLISGFVIPFSFRGSVTGFAINRAFRLLPALWLSIILCLAMGAELDSGRQLFANAFMLTDPLREAELLRPYWTLSWEMYFYALVSLAFVAGALQSPRTFGVLMIACGALSLFTPKVIYLMMMLTGTLLRMYLLERREGAASWLRIGLVTLGMACFVSVQHGYGATFVSLALALAIFVLMWKREARPAMIWLGSVSYSLYLFHPLVLEALAPLPTAAFLILGLMLPLVVAGLMYRWVEVPMMKLGRSLYQASPAWLPNSRSARFRSSLVSMRLMNKTE